DGEIRVDQEAGARAPLDLRAPERDLRVALNPEEVGRAQMRVPLLVARLDGGRVDLDLDPRMGRVTGDVDGSGDLGELAPHLAHHHWTRGEGDARLTRA